MFQCHLNNMALLIVLPKLVDDRRSSRGALHARISKRIGMLRCGVLSAL
jgi:hypothetical protein